MNDTLSCFDKRTKGYTLAHRPGREICSSLNMALFHQLVKVEQNAFTHKNKYNLVKSSWTTLF